MKPDYTNAVQKLDFIRLCTLRGQDVPPSQVRMLAETLSQVFLILDGVMQDPGLLKMELISALRVQLERRLMPFTILTDREGPTTHQQ